MPSTWVVRVRSSEDCTLEPVAWWVLAPFAGVGIVLLGSAAVSFSAPGSNSAAWWPASGVALSLVVLTPRRLLWGAAAVIFLATVIANDIAGRTLALSLWYGAANVLEAAVGVLVLTSGLRRPARLDTPEDTARLLLASFAAAATLGVSGGLGIALLTDGDLLGAAQSLTASHMAAHLIIVPLVLVTRSDGGVRFRPVEAVFQALLVVVTTAATYLDSSGLPTAFLPMPLLVWGAIRLTTRLVSFELLLLGVVMVLGTNLGRGPFGAHSSLPPSDMTLLLEASILGHALVAIPTVVAAHQRRLTLGEANTTRDELSSVLDSSQGVAIIAGDLSGRILVWGAGAASMFGYSREEVLAGMQIETLYAKPLGQEIDLEGRRAPLWAGAEVVEGDWEYVRKDGSEFTGHLRLSMRTSRSGEALGFLGVIDDISQARKTEDALRAALRKEHEAVERLAALDRSKNDFISSVSHELRTPITSVIGYADLIRADDITEQQRRLLDPVIRNAQRLEQLIEDLLTVSRMDGGTFVYRPALMDLRDTVRSAIEGVLVGSGHRQVEVIAELGDHAVITLGDGAQLERGVANLVSNAVKFTPDGGRVDVSLVSEGDTARITVEDTGVGIPRSEQSKVFDRFFRSSTSTSLAIDGTGLGLHIVNQVVSAHGGRVKFRSEEQKGTTFTVEMPIRTS